MTCTARTFIGLEYKSQGIKMVFRLTGMIYNLNSRTTTITADIRYYVLLFFDRLSQYERMENYDFFFVCILTF